MSTIIHRRVEFKLYPNKTQEAAFHRWLEASREVYNHALADWIGSWELHRKSLTLYAQYAKLVEWRQTVPGLAECPSSFLRDAIARVHKAVDRFFHRRQAGQRAGYPRPKQPGRYDAMGYLQEGQYLHGNKIRIPVLGRVRCGGYHQDTSGKQKTLRIILRNGEWFAQILCEREIVVPPVPEGPPVGIDLGLLHYMTFHTGETVENPRCFRNGQRKLRSLQRRAARKEPGSKNRKKAQQRAAKQQTKTKAQRKGHAHQTSRMLVTRFGEIRHEDLNIRSLCRGMLAKSIHDAGWGQLLRFIAYKAEEAGVRVVRVDPAGTSQECPNCGRICRKALSERTHRCPCGLVLSRDQASALVVFHRGSNCGATPADGLTAALGPPPG